MLIKIRERIINTNNIQYTYLDKYGWYKSCYQPSLNIHFLDDTHIRINIEEADMDDYRELKRILLREPIFLELSNRIINIKNIKSVHLNERGWYKSCYQPTVVIDFANDISIKINIENRDIDEYRCFERKLLLATI